MEDKFIRGESFGKIEINRFNSNNCQFFGSDIEHSGGIELTISSAEYRTRNGQKIVYPHRKLIKVQMSNSQFVDAITSGMNSGGSPVTIHQLINKNINQVDHVTDRKHEFKNDMASVQSEYLDKIEKLMKLMDGNLGKRAVEKIKFDLKVLHNHINSNTGFVMETFNEAMDRTITEAKQSVGNYIDGKIMELGLGELKGSVSIEPTNKGIEPDVK